ncbi:AIR synthase family protein [Christensenella intestinihominis]|uniref:AIR synthase family protein n=1 Tax=Christensenella intestinihominis TaxID=1851429 RepID=UPI00082ABE12|nr:AIR synthase family protein [Christensenella intestinihominis]
MRQGKLTNAKLRELVIDRLEPRNEETVVGAGVGEDCCAVMTGDLCVVSTDPITAGGKQTGVLAVHINANDIAAAGAKPIAALVTLLIPPSAGEEEVRTLMNELTHTARSLDIDIIGGHTEVTDSVTRMVVSVTMIGKPVVKGKMFKTSDVLPGDDLVMTKYAGLEGTAIIASDYAGGLSFTEEERDQLAKISGALSVVRDGRIAAEIEGVHAMHDITEGGVLGAVSEMCEASGVGARIDLSAVPVLPLTRRLCEEYGLDVYGLISSGSMMIAAEDGNKVAAAMEKNGIPATVIGKAGGRGVHDLSSGSERTITPYPADELYKVLERKL